MKTKHSTKLRRVRRRPKLGIALAVALVVGFYFLIKVFLPSVAGLLDGVFATVVERVGRPLFKDEA